MTLAGLAMRSAAQNPLRTALTVLGIGVGVMAFAFLRTVVQLWYSGARTAAEDRIIVRNRTSLIVPLPLAYREKILAVPGVARVTYGGWFGGVYKEERNFFPQIFVEPKSYLALYPEFTLTPEEEEAWLRDKAGVIVGSGLAERFGFRLGQTIRLKGGLYPGDWDVNIRGIYRAGSPEADVYDMFMRYDFVDERRAGTPLEGTVNYFAVQVTEPGRGPDVACAIDALFESSAAQTRAESERAFRLGFVAQSQAILLAIQVVSGVVLVIIALVVGNTLAQSVRERIGQHGTLRALGFSPAQVGSLVMGEALVVGTIGTALGLAAAGPLVQGFARIVSAAGGNFPAIPPSPATLATAAVVGPLVAGAAALVPAILASRAPAAAALRVA